MFTLAPTKAVTFCLAFGGLSELSWRALLKLIAEKFPSSD